MVKENIKSKGLSISGRGGEDKDNISVSTRFKKYFGFGDYEGANTWLARNWWILLTLGGIFLLGLLMRAYFYYPLANELGFSGNDPYYHQRVIEHIQQHHTHLIEDDLLNYPLFATNPRPPFFDWSVAIMGIFLAPFFGFNVATSTESLMYISPSLWGALTVIPVYMIGKEMFGKKAGLLGAFIMATMPSHIERSPAGFSDHDSIVVFFVVLSIFFLFRAFKTLDHRTWVKDWMNTNSIYEGITDFFSANQVAVFYSLLAGVSLSTIALTWKGFPYALAIVFIYFLFQVTFDRFRNVDSTGIFICIFLAFFTTLVVSYPYYMNLSFSTWITPLYLLLSIVIIGSFLIFTQKYPWILVIPLGVVVAIVGYLILSLIAPNVAQALATGQGYFIKSKLYSTIAEAQPPQFSRLAVAYSIFVFFFALIGIVRAAIQVPKHWKKENVFIVVWAIVAVYMAMSAVRFMFNATPVIAITAGWILYELVKKLNVKSKILIFYIMVTLGSLIILAWWGVENDFSLGYPWMIFIGFLALVVVPILIAVYDNYDKSKTSTYIVVILGVWTLASLVMFMMDDKLSWSNIGDVLVDNLSIWYFGLAALLITLVPIIILFSKKSYAITHFLSIGSITLILMGLRNYGFFQDFVASKTSEMLFGFCILPLLVLVFNLYFLYMDENYMKDSARKVLIIAMELWFLSFFFNPNIYFGIVCAILILVNIYLLTPYRKSFKHKTTPMHVLITLFATFFILLPQMWFAIDASLPYEDKWDMNQNMYDAIPDIIESDKADANKYFGAFGHGFTSEYWRAAFDWLSEQDNDKIPSERPAFVSWWDYGFWCAYMGQHPTAADNFQYGYQFAGSFISSQNETEAVSLMIARLIEGNYLNNKLKNDIKDLFTDDKYLGSEEKYISIISGKKLNAAEKVWEIMNHGEDYVDIIKDNPDRYGKYLELLPTNAKYAAVRGVLMNVDLETQVSLLKDLEDMVNKNIRYFAVDSRLFPFTAQNTGIFYAPIKLADKDIDEFLEYVVETTEGEMSMEEVEDRVEEDPDFREQIIDYKLKYTDNFYNSLFYRCYIGYSGKDLGKGDLGVPAIAPEGEFASGGSSFYPMQGWNMTHFRLVYKTMYYTPKSSNNASFPEDYTAMNFDEAQELYEDQGGYRISGLKSGAFFLEYYPGAEMRGRVLTEGDERQPMPGVRVVVYDEYGIPHDMSITDDDGNYELILPPGENTIVTSTGGFGEEDTELQARLMMQETTVLNQTILTVTKDQSNRITDHIINRDLIIKKGTVDGKLFIDNNNNGEYDRLQDEILNEGMVKIVQGKNKDIFYEEEVEDELYNFTTVLPGEYAFTVGLYGHDVEIDDKLAVTPKANEELNIYTKDIGIAPANLSGQLTFNNGSNATEIMVVLKDTQNGTVYQYVTNSTGHYYFDELLPGDFELTIEQSPYEKVDRTVKIAMGEKNYQNITLVQVAPVSGRVFFDSLGNGYDIDDSIGNARIRFIPDDSEKNITIAVSGSDGRYVTNLSLGHYTIYVDYVNGGQHYTYLGDIECIEGVEKLWDIELSLSFRVEGEVSFGSDIWPKDNFDINNTEVSIRKEFLTMKLPVNLSGYYSTYLPVDDYYITAYLIEDEYTAGIAGSYIVGDVDQERTLDLECEKAFSTSGCIYWDRDGDGKLTMGNSSLDVQGIVLDMENNYPYFEDPLAGSVTTDPSGTTTTETVPTQTTGTRADTRQEEDGSPEVDIFENPINGTENETHDYDLYENVTDVVLEFTKGNMVYRIVTNDTGFFTTYLPKGVYTVEVNSVELDNLKATIKIGEDEVNTFTPEISPKETECRINMGVDRNNDDIISPNELVGRYTLWFNATTPGAHSKRVDYIGGDTTIALLPGVYDISYSKDFTDNGIDVRHRLETNLSLKVGELEKIVDLFVQETVRFRGKSVTEFGEPADNSTLSLESILEGNVLEVVCNEFGYFDMFVPIGNYFINSKYTTDSGVYILRRSLAITSLEKAPTLIFTKAYPLNVTLYFDKNDDGKYQSTEKLMDIPLTITGDITTTHHTNYQGLVSTSLLPDKEYYISVHHTSADSTYRHIAETTIIKEKQAQDIRISVSKYIQASGKVYWDRDLNKVFSTDEKIIDGTIEFIKSDSTTAGEYTFLTGNDGKWSGYLPIFHNNTQEFDVVISAPGFKDEHVEKMIKPSSKTLDVRMDPLPVLYTGMIFEDLNNSNTKEITEDILAEVELSFISISKTALNVSVTTDSKGRYSVLVFPGEYMVKSLVKGSQVFISEFNEEVVLLEDKKLDIPLKLGKYVFGSVSYIDTNGNEHKDIDSRENGIIIKGQDNNVERDLEFSDGFYDTYLPYGSYSIEMKGYDAEEYEKTMTYELPRDTIVINDFYDFYNLDLVKDEKKTLELTIVDQVEEITFNRTINQGASVELEVIVKNKGNIPMNITLSGNELPEGWSLDIVDRKADLWLDEEMRTKVTVTTSFDALNTNEIEIGAESTAGSKDDVTLKINTHPKYEAEVYTEDKLDRGFLQNGSKNFNMTIKNLGNAGDDLLFYLEKKTSDLWNISIQNEELNSTGYAFHYSQKDIYKNVTIKVEAPNSTSDNCRFVIGVKGRGVNQRLSINGTITKPDISIKNVEFKNLDLLDKDRNVTMYVTLHASQADVGKFNFTVKLDGEKITELSETIDSIEQDADYTMVFDWNLSDEVGKHKLELEVDPEDQIMESDDTVNNIWVDDGFKVGTDDDDFNWRIVIAVVVVLIIVIVSYVIWRKKQVV